MGEGLGTVHAELHVRSLAEKCFKFGCRSYDVTSLKQLQNRPLLGAEKYFKTLRLVPGFAHLQTPAPKHTVLKYVSAPNSGMFCNLLFWGSRQCKPFGPLHI